MFKTQTLSRLLFPYIHDRADFYGRDESLGLRDPASPESGRKKIVVEFSSPNIASEFEGRHLRSTILGAYLSNIHESNGWEVVRINYLGDWGKPIGLLGVGWEKFGSEEEFEKDPAAHLLDINHKISELFAPELAASKQARDKGEDTAEIEAHGLYADRNAFFKKMEENDEKAKLLWKRVRDTSIANYEKLYARLNVSFDEYSGESQVSPATMAEVEEILKEKGLSHKEESGEAWIIDLKKHGSKAGTAIIRDRAGSSTYLLRDLAAALERDRKYGFDKMIYVVAADQHTVHFSRLFKILELMDRKDLAEKLQHVSFSEGMLIGETVRHGHLVDEILGPYQTAVQESLKENVEKADVLGDSDEVVDKLAVSSLLVQELSARKASHHVSDMMHSTSFEPGTGPDLQYWYTKVSSILTSHSSPSTLTDEDFASLEGENESNLLRLLVQYPDVTHAAYKKLESATVVSYLANVTAQLGLCFEGEESGNENGESSKSGEKGKAKAVLFESARVVLENGMRLLGITPAK
jgi:arginyl-tRNA synthetase